MQSPMLIYLLVDVYKRQEQRTENPRVAGSIPARATSVAPVSYTHLKEEDKVVLELSSFQLMTMDVEIDVAIVTNITPNHLDMHKDIYPGEE